MSEPHKKPDPFKSDPPKSDTPKKLQARTAGAAKTDEDVFKLLDCPEDEPGAAHDAPGEEKIGLAEALKMKSKDFAKAARRKSGQILTGLGGKKDGGKKGDDKNDGSKDGSSGTNTA